MSHYDETIIIGRVGETPELKKVNGGSMTNFPIYNWSMDNGQEVLQWHRIAVFGKQAKVVCEHIVKGDLICIEGRLSGESTDDGKVMPIITAENVCFLSSRKRPEPAETSEICEAMPG
jgi:single-strand DNA-binding protein